MGRFKVSAPLAIAASPNDLLWHIGQIGPDTDWLPPRSSDLPGFAGCGPELHRLHLLPNACHWRCRPGF